MKVLQLEIVLAPNGINFHNCLFPQGAMIGEDTQGYFACANYRCICYTKKTQRPVLNMWRFSDISKEWYKCTEGNKTTEEILDAFYDNESICENVDDSLVMPVNKFKPMAKGRKVRQLSLVKTSEMTFCDLKLPRGALYGYDEYGPFACKNYRLQGKSGFYKGNPRLKIWRPISEGKTLIRWAVSVEANNTTNAIFRRFMADPACEITYNAEKEVHKIAAKINNQPEFGEVHYTGINIRKTPSFKTSFEVYSSDR